MSNHMKEYFLDNDKFTISIFHYGYDCTWFWAWKQRARLPNRYLDLGKFSSLSIQRILISSFFLFILANFDEATVEKLPSSIYQGVYYGWAKLLAKDDNQIYKMVTSVGTNPFYNGEKKTMVR
jgi:hypothetical protein